MLNNIFTPFFHSHSLFLLNIYSASTFRYNNDLEVLHIIEDATCTDKNSFDVRTALSPNSGVSGEGNICLFYLFFGIKLGHSHV